ncbi:MAG: hypothetical protein Q9163_000395 [Psora crenata]
MLAADFIGFSVDPVLSRLLDVQANPDYADPRNCLVLWARPPQPVKDMINLNIDGLTDEALWLMPLEDLHMTVMEVTHSKTWTEVTKLVEIMEPKMAEITDYSYDHRARLIKPMVNYDGAAIAISFVPAAGEALYQGRCTQDDNYTYHNLRRDLYDLCQSAGLEVASRYVVPSSHLTIARFVNQDIFNENKVVRLIEKIELINSELRKYWPSEGAEGQDVEVLQWLVGEEKGLVCRKGTVWYGGGKSHLEGKGFFLP